MLQSFLGNVFGGGGQEGESSNPNRSNSPGNSRGGAQARTWEFQFPGGGQGRVIFGGNFAGGGGGFGSPGQGGMGGLDS